MKTPNVLIVPNDQDDSPDWAIVSGGNCQVMAPLDSQLPNLKANGAWYVTFLLDKEYRLYHVTAAKANGPVLLMTLGNSFPALIRPPNPTGRKFSYRPVGDYGFMEVTPGVLVALPEDVRNEKKLKVAGR